MDGTDGAGDDDRAGTGKRTDGDDAAPAGVDADAPDRGPLTDPQAPGPLTEIVRARGHENVTGTHGSTVEVTTDDFLTPAGDCIVAVEADRAPADFAPGFVRACRDPSARITLRLAAGGRVETVTGRGHPDLTFDSERCMVARTSDYVDDRTVLVGAGAAAADLDRDLVAALSGGADLTATLRVERAGE